MFCSAQERGGAGGVEKETALKQGDAYSTWLDEQRENRRELWNICSPGPFFGGLILNKSLVICHYLSLCHCQHLWGCRFISRCEPTLVLRTRSLGKVHSTRAFHRVSSSLNFGEVGGFRSEGCEWVRVEGVGGLIRRTSRYNNNENSSLCLNTCRSGCVLALLSVLWLFISVCVCVCSCSSARGASF